MPMKTCAEKEIELACEQERKLRAEKGSVDDASYRCAVEEDCK